MKMRRLFKRMLPVIALLMLGQQGNCYANDVKVGNAHITVNLSGDMPTDSDRIVYAAWNRIFIQTGRICESKPVINSDRTKFEFDIPLQTEKGYALIKVTDDSQWARAYAFLNVSDGDTLTLDCIYDHKDYVSVIPSSREGMEKYPMTVSLGNPTCYFLEQIKLNFNVGDYKPDRKPLDAEKIYAAGDKAWQETLKQLYAFYGPIIDDPGHKFLLKEEDIDEFENKLKNYIFAEYFLDYNKTRERWAPDGNRELPPLEYYYFILRDIDFDSVLDYFPCETPNHLLGQIIKNVPVGIEPIGDTPVAEWKAQTKEKLGAVMDNVPDRLLDLLSAASYFIQIDEAHTPLTDKQLKNISEGYSNDLGKVIIDTDNWYKSGEYNKAGEWFY